MMNPPMLLIFSGEDDLWKLYNPIENKILDIQLRVPNQRICGSSQGWLVLVEWNFRDRNFGVTLINPFLRIKGRREENNWLIRLPPLAPPGWKKWVKVRRKNRDDWVERCQLYVLRAILSADPVSNAKDCIVVVIHEERLELAFIRLGKDSTWTYIDRRRVATSRGVTNGCFGIQEVARVQDKFYALKYGREIFSFEVTPESHSNVELVACGFDLQIVTQRGCGCLRYLVEAHEGIILMVQRYIELDHEAGKRETKEFRIFELNSVSCEWIERYTLDGLAVFVGDNSSFSLLATKFPGCQPNCIYFNHDRCRAGNRYDFSAHDFGVYDIENRSFSRPYPTDVKSLMELTNRLPIWVTPSLQL